MSLGWRYLEHLGEPDRDLLAGVAGRRPQPEEVDGLLGHPRTFDAVFGPAADTDPFLRVTPFLTFAVAVHRARAELRTARFTEEWVGPRQKVPVFDVAALREVLDDPQRRLFLVELLASYTHVSSGATWVRTPRGWRKRRFSELDPVRLASLLEVVGEAERPGVYRRLGDLALFLTGVFPDHTAVRGLSGVAGERLARLTGTSPDDVGSSGELPTAVAPLGAVAVLEHLGARCYRLAAATAPRPLTAGLQAAAAVADRFRAARRVLNLVTDRFLYPFRTRWFPAG